MHIPVAKPELKGNEEKYVVQALQSTWISSSGEFLDRFEKDFATACDAKIALAVCNGTASLHLAMLALNVGPGDEVIVPTLTYIATANAVRYVGAKPVFVDSDPETWCLDPRLIEEAITPRTRGIIPVHLYGNPAAMNPIKDIAAFYGLWIVEDAAEAHFARYHGKPVGALGTIGSFSFYSNKILTCGEGGALVLNDAAMAIRLRALRGQGVNPARRYHHPIIGYNFRLTNVQAAILCAQLERSDDLLAARNQVCSLYRQLLADCPEIEFQTTTPGGIASPWMMCILLSNDEVRDRVAARLAESGIETRPLFIPIHSLPPYRPESKRIINDLPVAHGLSDRGLCLPTYAGLSALQVEEISSIILRAV